MKTRMALLALLVGQCGWGQTAEEILRTSENLLKGVSSQGRFRMTITTPEYTRTMEMEAWWVGDEKTLIHILSPKREAGNRTLKVNNELWMYLRNTETTIKVPPSMMLQSWNGSDFTNDDLVRESSIIRDYASAVIGRETVDGEPCWKLELVPRPAAPVVWGKIRTWIRVRDFLPVQTEYDDEKGVLMRTLRYSEFRRFGTRTVPARWKMINNARSGRSTEFEYLDVRFDIPISERIFSFQELEKGRRR